MKSFILFGVTCLGLVVAFVVRQEATTHAEIAKLRGQLAASHSDVRPARVAAEPMIVSRIESSEPRLPVTQEPVQEGPGGPVEPGDPGMPESELTLEAEQTRVEEELVRRTNELDGQPYDGQWAPTARAEIERGFGEMKGSALRKVECRSQLCRAEIEHADAEGGANFLRSLQVPGRFWKGEMEILAQPGPNGVESSVVFLGRPGWRFDS